MKKICLYVLICLLLIPSIVFAEDNELVSRNVKYYKTTYENDFDVALLSSDKNFTIEISEDEYNDVQDVFDVMESNLYQNSYKKVTTSIYSLNGNYKYEVNLEWKKIPKVRSNDIIAIGFDDSNIQNGGNYSFIQNFCTSDGCKSNNNYSLKNFSTGNSAVFSLPTSDLIYLGQTFSFMVMKKASNVVSTQIISGDYSHATKKIDTKNALKHTVDVVYGIKLYDSISKYYDSIPVTKTMWNGSW